ncbi:hypothetical protein BC938DRAFT_484137 [Jimgerdemannia flammicorona]|uniref:Plasmid pRiA4b Orf3-like domain-containing protein n=1 Tax=Jimgerdemannia flammicorona TaxID=994334 RepID=A0A433QAF4_9FUNG|nr:hypothetical protein BC938DRAFT_484137 [Jimgerdemannia flammicorona]
MSFATSFAPTEVYWSQEADAANAYLLVATISQPGFSIQPAIRRSVLVPKKYTLLQLHVVLVVVFGWQNRHQHEFVPAETTKSNGLFGSNPNDGRRLTNRPFSFLESLKRRGSDNSDQPSYRMIDISELDNWFKECAPGLVIEHSHPHEGSTTGFKGVMPPTFFIWHHLRDERLYTVEDLFISQSTEIRYRYDFGSGPEVKVALMQMAVARADVFARLPIYLGGENPSLIEDDYTEFQADLEPTYVIQNRLHQHHHPPPSIKQCYMCYWYRPVCRKSMPCVPGKSEICCAYCLHAPRPWDTKAKLTEVEARKRYEEAKTELERHRRIWVEDGKCEWVEMDGNPCQVCGRRKAEAEAVKAGSKSEKGGGKGDWLPEAFL